MEIPATKTGLTTKRALRISVLSLLLAPFLLLLLVAGAVFFWENPWLLRWSWIPIPFCWLIGFLLYRLGKKYYGTLWQPRSDPLLHWTERDRAAWQLVEKFADRTVPAKSDEFFTTDLYVETTKKLAQQLAVHYHPDAKDAYESLTIPELLTAAELAISDLRRFVEQNVPGSHLMTIRWLQRAPQLTGYWRHLRPLYYAASLVWHPWTVLSRAAANETVVNPVMNELKKDGLAGLYRAFVLQTGKYLIELNSHRLIVGPRRWRELMGASGPTTRALGDRAEPDAGGPARESPPPALRIALVGQVKAGKSSLVNALIGQRSAEVDVLPLTDIVEQYTLEPSGTDSQLVLLDTRGYAHAGLKADRVDTTMRTVCESAMTILVMNACDPARDPDCRLLDTMENWFQEHPRRRRPPVLVVLTHIDQLSPAMQWDPPYDGWVRPRGARPKEHSIRQAVVAVRELFDQRVAGVVPACTDVDRERAYGVQQWVIPAIMNLLPQAKAKQLLDVLYDEPDRGRTSQLMKQLWNAASTLAKYHFCGIDSLLPEPDHRDQDNQDNT